MSRVLNTLLSEELNNTEQSALHKLITLELEEAVVVGSGVLGDNKIIVKSAVDFIVGQSISISNLLGDYKIIDILDNTLYLNNSLSNTVTNEFVYFTKLLNITDSNFDILFDGITYMRFPVQMSDTTISSDGSIDKASLSVANVTREIMYYVEMYNGLVNRKITVKKVFRRFLDLIYNINPDGTIETSPNEEADASSFIKEEYIIDSYTANEQIVNFNLDPIINLNVKLPRRRYLDSNSCAFKYKDPETCKYSGSLTKCNKNLSDCKLHNNSINFGGFAGLDSSNQRRIWL